MASGRRTRLPESTAADQAATALARELHLHQTRSSFDHEAEDHRPAPRRVPVPVQREPAPETDEPEVQPERASEHEENVPAPAVVRQGPRVLRACKAAMPPIAEGASCHTSAVTSWTPQANSGVVSGRDVRRKD
jgi:hypothetical protein